MSVGWSDLGSWAALRDVWQARSENRPDGTTIGLGNRRDLGSVETLVLAGDRLVVTIGLTGVIVVDTPDALLICAADRSQEVRRIAEELAKPGRSPAANEEKKP
jgi:mannose-1-phosphate guanylyltransferase